MNFVESLYGYTQPGFGAFEWTTPLSALLNEYVEHEIGPIIKEGLADDKLIDDMVNEKYKKLTEKKGQSQNVGSGIKKFKF